jgi:D-alanine-D-alanine ligase
MTTQPRRRPIRKLRIGVIFGGRSAEHEVSLVSASSIMNALDPRKYVIVPIGIAPDGTWVSAPNVLTLMKERRSIRHLPPCTLSSDPRRPGLVVARGARIPSRLDVIFPVLHGTFGEDGTVQGLFDLAGIPYVGSGVLGSAVGMDKIVTKQLCEHAGIAVAPYLWFVKGLKGRELRAMVARAERELGYPAFVKPANSGSSVGISKAHNRKELLAAIALAGRYDRKILVEQGIEDAREIEVSVLGNDAPVASVPGEIISSNEFYDYDAKYVDGKSEAVIPAKLAPPLRKAIMAQAVKSYRAIDAAGMARVDFLVPRRTGKVILNEINTIPGFTSISMYPKLWEASGISYGRLLDRLVGLALERHRANKALKRLFTPKSDWYAS